MKKLIIIGLSSVILFLIITFLKEDFHENKGFSQDLPKEGGLSIIIIFPSNSFLEKPKFLSNHFEKEIFKIILMDIEMVDKTYPELNIKSAPYFIFLDSEGIVFETEDIKKAEIFYKNNVKDKEL